VHLEAEKAIKLGIVERRFACSACFSSFKTFNRFGYVVWWGLVALIDVLFTVGYATGRVRQGDGPVLVACMVVLNAFLIGIGGRALLADRRNPPLA
jgi:hypothetical protein